MPRYEVVAHLVVTSNASTPEEAATMLKQEVLAAAQRAVALRSLAVWPAAQSPSPLPDALRQQLAAFFAGVEQCAKHEEALFRARVEDILRGVVVGSAPETQADGSEGRELPATEAWESEGGASQVLTHEGIT